MEVLFGYFHKSRIHGLATAEGVFVDVAHVVAMGVPVLKKPDCCYRIQ